MGKYGSKTPKRHVGFSNASVIGKIDLGALTRLQMKAMKRRTATSRVYINGKGVRCWSGTKQLKQTQLMPQY